MRLLAKVVVLILSATSATEAADMPEAGKGTRCSCGENTAAQAPVVTRSYPICYFNKKPGDEELARLEQKLIEFMKPYMPSGVLQTGMSPNNRWISVKGMQSGHVALKKVWPQIGCYGNYITQSEYVQHKRCTGYLEQLLKQNSYTFSGETSDGEGITGQLFCDGK
ncbi:MULTISPECIES: hypothetical protein [Rhizobiaceae]|jgi:hypothetical protein|uniref:Uncharacterized protein n=1 Tax=Aliirhizobium cellulosilyticum TaxID=393664 RepID=A0A7W6Y5D5_9HYPH|nr:hypothetical protein [Rhizobium cellulosilyticum]MBB4350486.1 hypothetical protein [Rhizobium cellulosilyticum]MBB4413482.1 hypothetical protein [Rhizobium cellulosilyticum]MBB4448115.1 hypothetical protein [Rhizobium cellulosilyticum]